MASFVTPTGMLSFPALFVPKPAAPGAEPRFSINLIFDETAQKTPEYRGLWQGVIEAINEKWNTTEGGNREWRKKNKVRLPFRACSERDYTGYDVPNGVFIAPWSKNKPGLIDAYKQPILVPGDVWAGQLARCSVHPFAYEQTGNKGVSFNLNNVQIVKSKMPRLDGRKAAEDEFDEIADPEAGDTSAVQVEAGGIF